MRSSKRLMIYHAALDAAEAALPFVLGLVLGAFFWEFLR